jgi:hypothetical protein
MTSNHACSIAVLAKFRQIFRQLYASPCLRRFLCSICRFDIHTCSLSLSTFSRDECLQHPHRPNRTTLLVTDANEDMKTHLHVLAFVRFRADLEALNV